MIKKVLILFVVIIGASFGLIRSENWTPQNLTVTSNSSITLPYGRTGFLCKNLGANAVNVVITNASVTATDNIQGYGWFDYYPNSWSSFVSTDGITLNAPSGTSNVYIETYELNE